MSQWLRSVNTLLDKLDDRVENVVEERVTALDGEISSNGAAAIDDILAKRGLSKTTNDDDETTQNRTPENDIMESRFDEDGVDVGEEKKSHDPSYISSEKTDADYSELKGRHGIHVAAPEKSPPASDMELVGPCDKQENEEMDSAPDNEVLSLDQVSGYHRKSAAGAAGGEVEVDRDSPCLASTSEASVAAIARTPNHDIALPRTPPRPKGLVGVKRTEKEKELVSEIKGAQKEARTLRRHVVALNSQLESAESELQAQRKELERAAERMEKDRERTKRDKQSIQSRHEKELAALKSQFEKSFEEEKSLLEAQLHTYKNKLADVEDRRKQEGGDWSKEVSQAAEREQEISQHMKRLEDEKGTLLSQITTLQGQQLTLGSRLEGLTQAMDDAMEREREAEDRLDAALTQHAKQISQRQAREAELELTVQELNAALVMARDHTVGRIQPAAATTVATSDATLKARIDSLELELQTSNNHLTLEREKSQVLHGQLRELSKETTQEASALQVKQLRYDRQIAEMSLTITKLEASARENDSTGEKPSNEVKDDELSRIQNQVTVLSDEVLRLRNKIAQSNSEGVALRNRFQAAVDRATKAEEEFAALASSSGNNGIDAIDNTGSNQTNTKGYRRRPGAPSSGSIRSAMRLAPGQGERSEQIGKVVDVVDSFAGATGKYLRRNPLARAGFIFYLLLIHLWTFVLLFFHAHSFENEHSNFGTGFSNSPHGLMHYQKQRISRPADLTVGIEPGIALDQAAAPKIAGGQA